MTTALAEITESRQAVQWARDEIATIRATVAKDATNDELKMFLHLSQTYGLDPFAKEIWFIKMGRTPTIMTSRDGYLKIANNSEDYDGMVSDVVYEGDTFKKTVDGVEHVYGANKRGAVVGAYALVYRRDKRFPSYVFAPFKDYNSGRDAWRQYPHAMILKVAESMALKRAFSLSGLVTREEMDAAQEAEPERRRRNGGAVDAEIVREAQKQGAGASDPQYFGVSAAEVKKSLYEGYLKACGGVQKHAQNAMLKVTEGRGSKDWTEKDIEALTLDLHARKTAQKAEPERTEEAVQEGELLLFGEAVDGIDEMSTNADELAAEMGIKNDDELEEAVNG